MIRFTRLKSLENRKYGLTLTIEYSEVTPMEVFLYRMDLDGSSNFVGVCDIADLEFPTDTPGEGIPFFRKLTVKLLFDNVQALEAKLASLTTQIENLDKDFIVYTEGQFGDEVTVEVNI